MAGVLSVATFSLGLALQQCLETGPCAGVGGISLDPPWPGVQNPPLSPSPGTGSGSSSLRVQKLAEWLRASVAGMTAAAAATVAATCLARVAGLTGLGPDPCRSLPIQVPGLDIPNTTAHISSALIGRPWQTALNYFDRKRTDWYNRATYSPNPCTGRGVGTACDEFPYLKTAQGGSAFFLIGLVSLRPVPQAESNTQGGHNAQITACVRARGDSRFLVVPGPVPKTTLICPS